MATLKQTEEAYKNLLKAKLKLQKAIREAEEVDLLTPPAQYSDGYYRGINEAFSRIEQLSADPLAKALQRKLRKDIYGY